MHNAGLPNHRAKQGNQKIAEKGYKYYADDIHNKSGSDHVF